MSVTRKPLAQTRPPANNTAVAAYSPAAGVEGIPQLIVIVNVGTGTDPTASYTIYLDIDGAVFDDDSLIQAAEPLAVGEEGYFVYSMPMTADATLGVESTVGGALNFTVFGTEET